MIAAEQSTDSSIATTPGQGAADGAKAVGPAVFLDRDGVIIENRVDYVKNQQEVAFVPGAVEALQALTQAGCLTVMVTNQSVVGRGIISEAQALEVNRYVLAELESRGAKIDAWYMCPHHPNDECGCRKPAPGMLQQAAGDFGLILRHATLVGDAASDIEAARAVGVKGILVLTGRGKEQRSLMERAGRSLPLVVADLHAAARYLLATSGRVGD